MKNKFLIALCLSLTFVLTMNNGISRAKEANTVGSSVRNWQQDSIREIRIRIEKGRSLTNKRKLNIEISSMKLSSKLVQGMKISFSRNLQFVDWEPFKTQKVLNYEGSEGVITVYAQMKDIAGNLSNIAQAQITLDETPPKKGNVIINKGSEFSNNAGMRVRLLIKNEDAYKMQVSNDPNFKTGTWEDYIPRKTWMMSPKGEGSRSVYVRFADKAANISDYCTDSIKFDLTPPVGEIKINNDEKYTNSRLAILKIKASEDATITRIIGSNNVENIPYQEDENEKAMIKDWYLDSAQGNKVIKVLFRDNAGNISKSVAYDDIILDTQTPEISYFKINRGKKYTTQKNGLVSLYIGTKSLDNDFQMYISNDSTFEGVQPQKFVRILKDWKIKSQLDGMKSVYAKFVDRAGNESTVRKASIILDREPPKIKSFTINNNDKFTRYKAVKLQMEVEDVLASQFSNDSKFLGANWEKYQPLRNSWLIPTRDGVKTVYAKFRDRAGNETTLTSDDIIKDSTPPPGKVILNEGKKFSNHKDLISSINFEYDKEAILMQYNIEPKFEEDKWIPVQKEIKNFQFSGGDGEKRIFVKFKDSANNISETFTSRVIFDRQPPQNVSVAINGDSLFVDRLDKLVRINFNASGVQFMKYSFTPEFTNAKWVKFTKSLTMNLEGEDGVKTIYVKYKDQINNISKTVKDDIVLDRYPPKAKVFKIDNGEEWTNNKEKKVTLTIDAEEAKDMIISSNPNFEKSKWQPFQSKIDGYILDGEDGYKTLYIAFRDEYGHISKPLNARIRLKREF